MKKTVKNCYCEIVTCCYGDGVIGTEEGNGGPQHYALEVAEGNTIAAVGGVQVREAEDAFVSVESDFDGA